MTETPGDGAAPLQFDRIETEGEAPQGLACTVCRAPLHAHYYELNGHPTCERCRYGVEESLAARGGPGDFLKAALFGLAGGLAGAAVYYAVLALFHLEIALLSILVGWLAGTGVAKGSRGKGGWVYQTLAIGITYLCIVSTYVPMILGELEKMKLDAKPAATASAPTGASGATQANAAPSATTTPASAQAAPPEAGKRSTGRFLLKAVGILILAALAPFLQGARSILGLLIIFFGLLQAWRLNRKATLAIAGPFQIRAQRPAAPSGA